MMMEMKKLCPVLAALCMVAAFVLELISSLSYPDPNKITSDVGKKVESVEKYHNWALVLAVFSVYFAVMCMVR
jgi:hypothetical protein